MKLYPCGYAAYAALITHLMQEHPHLLMIDTRRKPRSHFPAWRGTALKATYGERYRWAGQLLGNLNYESGGPICLADPVAGVRELCRWLQYGYDLLLLCGCAVYERCHLHTIVEALQSAVPEIEVILPEQCTFPAPHKCLSIRQPWAWLLTHPEEVAACGIAPKRIENRNWCPHYRGPLLLHASTTIEMAFFDRKSGLLLPDYWSWKFGATGERLAQAMPRHRGEYVTGSIVGAAELVDVVNASDSPWFVGEYGLILAYSREITPPVPYPGQRMLFEVPNIQAFCLEERAVS